MFKRIRKRDGRLVKFDPEKITNALLKAGSASREIESRKAKQLTIRVLNLAEQSISAIVPTVEDIQDIVEEVLLSSTHRKTAKAFIIYREQHARLREITDKSNVELMQQYLKKVDWQVNENSNMTYSLQGLNHYVSSEITKKYWLNNIYPADIRKAHSGGDFHIHDLGMLAVYCVGWDLYDLLMEGFKGVRGKVESKPARHFRSALGQLVNFFYTLQGESAGAQAVSNFDTLLAPFIRYDGLSYIEVKQALQEFIFNINVPTRVGFQTPFTNVTLDLVVPSYYAREPVIRGGEPQKEKYGEFGEEMKLFNRVLSELLSEGDAGSRVFTFPIPTYNITRDFDWDDPDLEGLWKMTAKYGTPYFSNFVNSDMNPEDARSMCCRLRIDNRKLYRRGGGGLFGSNPLTGSIGVVTINMPRLGYLAEDESDLLDRLESIMELAKESLEVKRKVLERFTEANLYPYSKFYLRSIKARFGGYWKNHFSTIGLLGMNEACLNLLGEDIAGENGKSFTLGVMDFMRKKLVEFQQETGNYYNLEATPSEGTSHRLARRDFDRYGDMLFGNGDGREVENVFYTNSTHLPVDYSDDLFEVLEHQDEIQTRYTGGTVLHFYLGEQVSDASSIKNIVRKVCESYRLPYFTFSPTFSICPRHGYLTGEQNPCDICGTATEVYSRIVGYLRPVDQWNQGKKEEFRLRKTYDLKKRKGGSVCV